MQYDLQVEDVSASRRRFRFTVPGELVTRELDRAFRDLKRRVRMPGFRPGKVPRNLLEQRFGRQVRGEVGSNLINEAWREAASHHPVVGQPAVEEQGEIAPNTSFTFTIGADVRPSIEVSDYKDLRIEVPKSPVTDADVGREVARRLQSEARIEEVTEDRPVEEGDFVLAEVKLVHDGETVVDEPGTLVNTRDEQYYPGIEPLLLGLKKGESKTETVVIDKRSKLDELAGRSFEATVKVRSIQAYLTPDLDDVVAKDLGFEDAADMLAKVRKQLEGEVAEAAKNEAQVNLLRKLVEVNDFEVPNSMVQEQLDMLVEEIKVRRAWGGQDPRSIRISDAEMVDLRARARFAAKASCILEAVARQEGIEVTDADLDAKVQKIAEERGQAMEAIRGYLEREGATEVLRQRIMEEKTLNWLLDHNEIVEIEPEVARADALPDEQDAAKATEGLVG